MDSFEEFLTDLFWKGRVVLRDPPRAAGAQDRALPALLRKAFEVQLRDVAGPPLEFHALVAVKAAEIVWRACWALVHRDEDPNKLLSALCMPEPPVTASAHLSADLSFRYLPQVHRRSKATDPSDVLTEALAKLFCEWPLSGVLSDLQEGPLAPPDFSGHPGLMLLYCERYALHNRLAWKPAGETAQYLDLVVSEMGQGRRNR